MPDDRTLFYDSLSDDHAEHIAAFACGQESWEVDLEDFLRNDALRDQGRNLSRTYLFFSEQSGERRCVGFVTLLATSIQRQDWHLLPRLRKEDIQYQHVPAILIGRLAVRNDMQKKGVGKEILTWVRALVTDLQVGCRLLALHVDKANVGGVRFYEREGFVAAPVKPDKDLSTMLYDLMVQPESGQEEGEPV